jgi:hypothetical protein
VIALPAACPGQDPRITYTRLSNGLTRCALRPGSQRFYPYGRGRVHAERRLGCHHLELVIHYRYC